MIIEFIFCYQFDNILIRLKKEHTKARHFVYAYQYINEFEQIIQKSIYHIEWIWPDEIDKKGPSFAIQKGLKNIKENIDDRTVILVTHKTSLLSLVDGLIVMDEGMVLLDDSKDSVIKKLKNKA